MNKILLILIFLFLLSNLYSQYLLTGFPITLDTNDGSTGTAASPIVTDFDKDGFNEILCGVCLELYTGSLFLISHTGQVKSGWPKKVYGVFNFINTAAGDLNKDGFIDVIVRAGDSIYAFDYLGNNLSGFPIYFGNNSTYTKNDYIGLYDINKDGFLEIITYNKNRIGIINKEGQFLNGFPKLINLGNNTQLSMFTLIDLDDDQKCEIVIPATNFTTYADSNAIIVLKYNGENYPNTPIYSDSSYYFGFSNAVGFKSPISNQKMFLICSNFSYNYNPYTFRHRINLYNKNCNLISRAYLFNSIWELNQLSVSNIDDDISIEGFCTNSEYIFGFKQNGVLLSGYPIYVPNSSPYLGVIIGKLSDTYNIITGLGMADKNFIDTNKGYIRVFKINGVEESWSPLRPNGFISFAPTICDLNNDGQTDLCAVSTLSHLNKYSTIVYVWTFPGVEFNKFNYDWKMFGHDRYRTNHFGFVPDDEPVSIRNNKTYFNNFQLYQNYPNPFNSSTKIKFSLPYDAYIKLEIYDIFGRIIKIIVDEYRDAGDYIVTFEGKELASGIYFYKLQFDGFCEVKRMVFIK